MIVATKIQSRMCESGYIVHFEIHEWLKFNIIQSMCKLNNIIYLFHDRNDWKSTTSVWIWDIV